MTSLSLFYGIIPAGRVSDHRSVGYFYALKYTVSSSKSCVYYGINFASNKLSSEEIEIMDTSLQTIQEESHSPKPKKKIINMAIAALKGIKGSAEFAAALAPLIQFLARANLL